MRTLLKVALSAAILLLLAACVVPTTRAPASTPLPSGNKTVVPASGEPVPSDPTSVPTPAGTPVTITTVKMMAATGGWGIGTVKDSLMQRVLRTEDSGATWKDVTPTQSIEPAAGNTAAVAAFYDIDHAWVEYYNPTPSPVSGDQVVHYTLDGGRTWQVSQPLEMPSNMEFFMPGQIGFSDLQNGWLLAHLGAGMSHDYVALYRTADGGQSWQRVVDPSQDGVIKNSLPMSCSKMGAVFQDAQNGWVSGTCNGVLPGLFLYRTIDGGTTWLPVTLDSPPSNPTLLNQEGSVCTTYTPIFASKDLAAMFVSCVLQNGANQGWLYTSRDSGNTWTPEALPEAHGNIDVISSGNAWILGGASLDPNEPKALFMSPNAGKDWTPKLQEMNWSGDIDFIDPLTGWAIARNGSSLHLLKTTDGGASWVELEPIILP